MLSCLNFPLSGVPVLVRILESLNEAGKVEILSKKNSLGLNALMIIAETYPLLFPLVFGLISSLSPANKIIFLNAEDLDKTLSLISDRNGSSAKIEAKTLLLQEVICLFLTSSAESEVLRRLSFSQMLLQLRKPMLAEVAIRSLIRNKAHLCEAILGIAEWENLKLILEVSLSEKPIDSLIREIFWTHQGFKKCSKDRGTLAKFR